MAFPNFNNFDVIPVEVDLTATAADKFTWKLRHPIQIHSVEFVVSTAVSATTTAPVVSFDHTPSGGTRTEKGTATIANGSAVGTNVRLESATKAITFVAQKDDTIIFKHKTQGAGGTPAGKGFFIIFYELISDGEV